MDEAGHKIGPAAYFVPAESERPARREVGEAGHKIGPAAHGTTLMVVTCAADHFDFGVRGPCGPWHYLYGCHPGFIPGPKFRYIKLGPCLRRSDSYGQLRDRSGDGLQRAACRDSYLNPGKAAESRASAWVTITIPGIIRAASKLKLLSPDRIRGRL